MLRQQAGQTIQPLAAAGQADARIRALEAERRVAELEAEAARLDAEAAADHPS